jgi:hypothetical protein
MIKTLRFGEKDVQFSTSFAWALRYKAQFGNDPVKILIPALKKLQNTAEEDQAYAVYEELGVVGAAQIAWAMAQLVDRSIPDFDTWVASFGDDFDTLAIVQELLPAAIESCFSSKNLATPPKKDLKKAPKAETIPE